MQTEEEDIAKVVANWWGEVVLVNLVEDKVEVCWNVWNVCLDKVNEDVNGVGIYSGTCMTAVMEDGGANVAMERIELRRRRFGWVVLCWDWWGV